MSCMKNCRGSAVADVLIFAAVVVFVIMPVFSIIVEKYIIQNKIQIIRDAADMAAISAYNAINTTELSKADVDMKETGAERIYRQILACNLQLDSGMMPTAGSIAADAVKIRSLVVYTGDFPHTCPRGIIITRPSVHCLITVPIKPSLYRKLVLNMMGREFLELEVHVDSEIPLNN